MDDSIESPTAGGANEGGTLPKIRTLQFFSPDNEGDDSDNTSEHSLDEIDEGDNEDFGGFTAMALKGAFRHTRRRRWRRTPEVEREKKRIFVKQSFKVIRYQLRDALAKASRHLMRVQPQLLI